MSQVWSSADARWAWLHGWKIDKDGTITRRNSWLSDPIPRIYEAAARGDDFHRRALAEVARRRLAA